MTLENDPKCEEKLTWGLENNMRNLANFHQSTSNGDSKLGLLWGTFIPSRKCMSLKFTGELCVMRMKNVAKIEEKLTSQFKTGMSNLTDSSTPKSQKCAL